MQNKSAIWIFTVLLALASIYQISFSFFTSSVEKQADTDAAGQVDHVMDSLELDKSNEVLRDSVQLVLKNGILRKKGSESVYPLLGYTYDDCREREMKIGLDLKGGMNVVLEVSISGLVKSFAANKAVNQTFQTVMTEAEASMANSNDDFITLFANAWAQNAGDKQMVDIFNNRTYKDKFPKGITNEDCIAILRKESEEAIKSTQEVIRTRIDGLGVVQPTIQRQGFTGRILIELPGVKDKEGVRRILQSTANLEFFYTYNNFEISPKLEEINKYWANELSPQLKDITAKRDSLVVADSLANAQQDTLVAQTANAADSLTGKPLETDASNPDQSGDAALQALLNNDSTTGASDSINGESFGQLEELNKKIQELSVPIFKIFQASVYQNPETQSLQWSEGCRIGAVHENDTAQFMKYVKDPGVKGILPKDLRLIWGNKADQAGAFSLYCIKVTTKNGKAELEGESIIRASQEFDQLGSGVEVTMQFNNKGAGTWKKMTAESIGRSAAIVLDNKVYSAPIVQGEIPSGNTSITFGGRTDAETIREAQLLATILEAGSLPAPAVIVDEAIVGPSLGEQNVRTGVWSFIIALILVLMYMIFYYSKAGIISNVALLANIFFLFGALASLQASLTLPGIAGIVLTIGMSVDANVLIYERIREEIRAGKGMRLAILDGYKRAYAAIIDANITTLLTAMVLFTFGSGPIKGFATTLIIGIFTSLFSAIFITRLLFIWQLDRKKNIRFSTSLTKDAFTKINIGFIQKRKFYYVISGLIVAGGIASLAVRGLNTGVDFTGGRTWRIAFVDKAQVDNIKKSLDEGLVDASQAGAVDIEVKTIEQSNKVKITTNFRSGEKGTEVNNEVDALVKKLCNDVQPVFKVEESRTVDPTISDDIKASAGWAVSVSLIIIFLYIIIRFRKWQYGLGALVAMLHDVAIVLGLFSMLYGILPFSMEVDQAFIAAILTVVGYSINDTVVVFDRIREFTGLYKRENGVIVVNRALNSTLSRTVNTSLSTFMVLLIIFLFGGEAIKGFTFALMIGVVAGTYSSLCIATPTAVDLSKSLRDGGAPSPTA